MSMTELVGKTSAELENTLVDLRKEQFSLRMLQGTGQLARPSEMRRVRKEIARVKTVMSQQKSGDAS